MQIEEKILHVANRDVNRMTNIKKDVLGKKEMQKKVTDLLKFQVLSTL